MGKKRKKPARTVRRRTARPPAATRLAELETQAEQLEQRLRELLNQRAELARELARLRRDEGLPAWDLDADHRRAQLHEQSSRGPLHPHTVGTIFRELYGGMRELTRPLRVAYLGPQYSYSHLAAVERFGSAAELVPVATIAAVFFAVNRGQADHGLVPIENSTDGRVADTLSMFARLPVQICGEVQLRIRHALLGRCTQAKVTEVYSKPQALSQCREWLAQHLPQARAVEMTSTAAAAQLAAEKPGVAAIASPQAATAYALGVIAADIQDNVHNVTRFAVIGEHAAPATGFDKTALMFEIPHRPGALADAMNIFKRNRLNLTWIESFPMPTTRHEYVFFVECEGHQGEPKVRRALEELARHAVRLEVLGSYARSQADAPAEAGGAS